jgi:hypothetical protein
MRSATLRHRLSPDRQCSPPGSSSSDPQSELTPRLASVVEKQLSATRRPAPRYSGSDLHNRLAGAGMDTRHGTRFAVTPLFDNDRRMDGVIFLDIKDPRR